MSYQKYICSLIYLYVCTVLHVFSQDEACDKSKCPGPIEYYEGLRCVPTYSSEGSCCAVKYNCDHLKERSTDKCYYRGQVYELGEKLRDEDAQPCDIGCVCVRGYRGSATFNCAVVDCFFGPVKPGCYQKRSHKQCCPGEEVCPQDASERATCNVDGKIYRDSESFIPESDPQQYCICSEGYTGENVEPFCKNETSYSCGVELRHSDDIYANCAPVFYSTQNPATDCSVFSRCQNDDDRVVDLASQLQYIPNSMHTPASINLDDSCTFGNLTMEIGDELNSGTDYNSVCVKCVCEVPPLPTCQRLPDEECDVTKHAPFNNYQ